jgi:RimJ/RimL family protein N-acetyltransferase
VPVDQSDVPELVTDRLRLRGWRTTDRGPFAAMNADPAVMATLGPPMTRAESDAFVDRLLDAWTEHGFGMWAVEERAGGRFVGMVGLMVPRFDAVFTPCVEIGWRIVSDAWGRGYAPEAARAVVDHARDVIELDELLSFTAATNDKSQRVMHKLGMTRVEEYDFDHPRVPLDSPLRPHVVYRLPLPAVRR